MNSRIFCLIFLLFYSCFFSQDVFTVARSGTLSELKDLEKRDRNCINHIDERSFTPLILACYRKNTEVAEYLIERVDNIDYISVEGTALAAVSVNYDENLVKKLLKNNANPNLADSKGITPLIWAVKFKNRNLINLLLAYGADKTLKDENNKTAFEYAIESKNVEIINLLKTESL